MASTKKLAYPHFFKKTTTTTTGDIVSRSQKCFAKPFDSQLCVCGTIILQLVLRREQSIQYDIVSSKAKKRQERD